MWLSCHVATTLPFQTAERYCCPCCLCNSLNLRNAEKKMYPEEEFPSSSCTWSILLFSYYLLSVLKLYSVSINVFGGFSCGMVWLLLVSTLWSLKQSQSKLCICNSRCSLYSQMFPSNINDYSKCHGKKFYYYHIAKR